MKSLRLEQRLRDHGDTVEVACELNPEFPDLIPRPLGPASAGPSTFKLVVAGRELAQWLVWRRMLGRADGCGPRGQAAQGEAAPGRSAPEKRPRERLVGELAGGLCREERVDVPGGDAEFGEDLGRVLADPGQHQAGAVGWLGAA